MLNRLSRFIFLLDGKHLEELPPLSSLPLLRPLPHPQDWVSGSLHRLPASWLTVHCFIAFPSLLPPSTVSSSQWRSKATFSSLCCVDMTRTFLTVVSPYTTRPLGSSGKGKEKKASTRGETPLMVPSGMEADVSVSSLLSVTTSLAEQKDAVPISHWKRRVGLDLWSGVPCANSFGQNQHSFAPAVGRQPHSPGPTNSCSVFYCRPRQLLDDCDMSINLGYGVSQVASLAKKNFKLGYKCDQYIPRIIAAISRAWYLAELAN